MGTENGPLQKIIQKMVQDEIRVILVESRENIKEIVAATLIPGLKAAVREEINQSLEIILEQSTEKTKSVVTKSAPSFNNSEIPNPQSPMGLYLYSIADGADTMDLGPVGLDGNRVYAIPFGDLSAVVHDCKADPYQSDDRNKVKEWVLTHQKVVDAALEKFGTVIPMGFDTIISGKGDVDPLKKTCGNGLKPITKTWHQKWPKSGAKPNTVSRSSGKRARHGPQCQRKKH